MALGYDGKLYILAFDHRGSFQKKWFGLGDEITQEDTDRITDAKTLIYEGLELALSQGADASITGALVDEQFGGEVPGRAKDHGIKLAMPVEKSGQNEFDFQYGDDFGAHIEKFDPDFSTGMASLIPWSLARCGTSPPNCSSTSAPVMDASAPWPSASSRPS